MTMRISAEISRFKAALAKPGGPSLIGNSKAANYVTDTLGWELQSGGTSANVLRYIPPAEWAKVLDYTSTTDLTAYIQAALDAERSVFFPAGLYLFSALSMKTRSKRAHGAGARHVVLRHTGAATAITCLDGTSTSPDGRGVYIEEGWFGIEDLTIQANGTVAIDLGKTRSSFTTLRRLYIRHRLDLDGAGAGINYKAGAIGIRCDNAPWQADFSTYVEAIESCFLRGFEDAVVLSDTVNSWSLRRVYTIECKNQIRLDGATGVSITECYFESGIAGARGIIFGAKGGNAIHLASVAFELTGANSYAYDFTAAGAWQQVTATSVKYLINGDGGAVNNRRIIGTAPVGFVELNRSYTSATHGEMPMLWAPGAAIFQLPKVGRFGGFGQGNGQIRIGRGDTDAADSTLTQTADGSLELQAYEVLRLNGPRLGFFGAGGATKPAVVGSRGGNAALASLIGALTALGLVTDNTTA